jgi:hypothetical protein
MIGCLLRVMSGTTHPAGTPQVLQQLFLQGATGLDKEGAINGLV